MYKRESAAIRKEFLKLTKEVSSSYREYLTNVTYCILARSLSTQLLIILS